MDVELFKNQYRCTTIVVIEMFMAISILTLFVFLVLTTVSNFRDENDFFEYFQNGVYNPGIMAFFVRLVVLIHLMVIIFILWAGKNILNRACLLSPVITDCNQLAKGVKSCKIFCNLELLRLFLIVVTFLGEISVFDLSFLLELLRNLVNAPVIFGWIIASEYQKELENHISKITNMRSSMRVFTAATGADFVPISVEIDPNDDQQNAPINEASNSQNEKNEQNENNQNEKPISVNSLKVVIENEHEV